MIFMLAGTSDARELASLVKDSGFALTASVVTDEAAGKLQQDGIPVQVGRMPADKMTAYIKEKGCSLLLDASHPFAEDASKNAMEAAEACSIPYIRYERASIGTYDDQVHEVSNYEEAAKAAAEKGGTVFLTTGSKTLATFTDVLLEKPSVRMLCRMLPRKENMEKCEDLGVAQKDIVAIQGPFSKELNKALYNHYDVDVVVTKESGKQGSFDEKVTAALELGLDVILISRPKISYGTVFTSAEKVIEHIKSLPEDQVALS